MKFYCLFILFGLIGLCMFTTPEVFAKQTKLRQGDNELVRIIAVAIVEDTKNIFNDSNTIFYKNGDRRVDFTIGNLSYSILVEIDAANFRFDVVDIDTNISSKVSFDSYRGKAGIIPFSKDCHSYSTTIDGKFLFYRWNNPNSTVELSEANKIGYKNLNILVAFFTEDK